MLTPRLLYLVSDDRYFCSHRLHLAKAALEQGYQVAVATCCTEHSPHSTDQETRERSRHPSYQSIIEQQGIRIYPLRHFNRADVNPWQQLRCLRELMHIYRDFKPDVVHHVALKPVLLGSLIAHRCKVPKIINALGGLGYLFTEQASELSLLKKIQKKLLFSFVCKCYRWAFSHANTTVLLQNLDDKAALMQQKCVKDINNKKANNVVVIPGSGIDTKAYPFLPEPSSPPIIVCCISRMLWDKGIGELVVASKILQSQNIPIKIRVYGTPDPDNPASIPQETLERWDAEGWIEWRGFCDDVAKAYAECHIAVLPSYREGLPKSLLEAASCGRPIITTDVPGCREVVKEGENGLRVPAKDAERLAEKIGLLAENKTLRIQMGQRGRKRMEDYFSNEVVLKDVLSLYV